MDLEQAEAMINPETSTAEESKTCSNTQAAMATVALLPVRIPSISLSMPSVNKKSIMEEEMERIEG